MDNRNQELAPGYNKTSRSTVKGKRLFNTTSLLKKEATPGDVYYVAIPKSKPSHHSRHHELDVYI